MKCHYNKGHILAMIMGVFLTLFPPLIKAQNNTSTPPIDGEANKDKTVVTKSYAQYLKKLPKGSLRFKFFDKKVSEFLSVVSSEWSICKKSPVLFNSVNELFLVLIHQGTSQNFEVTGCEKGQTSGNLQATTTPGCNVLSKKALSLLKKLTNREAKLAEYLFQVEEVSSLQADMIQTYLMGLTP